MKDFRITDGKGFALTFDNGWTVSVQFGAGNYSDNHGCEISSESNKECGKTGSNTAEVAAWDKDNNWLEIQKDGYTDMVDGYLTSNDVLDFINLVAKK